MNLVLTWCLLQPSEPPAVETAEQWAAQWPQLAVQWACPVELAIAGGFRADRLAWAFASGYQAAMRSLVKNALPEELFALCATEEADEPSSHTKWHGTNDREIVIHGVKTWAPMGLVCTRFFVVISAPLPGEALSQTRVVQLTSTTKGVSLTALAPGKMLPELGRARLQMQDVRTERSAMLEGDGWKRFVKPFREYEATYLTAAVLAYLLREGRARNWPSSYMQRLMTSLSMLCDLSHDRRDAPMQQVVFAGAIDISHQLIEEASAHWATHQDLTAQRWDRDSKLLQLSAAGSEKRAAKAWKQLLELYPN